MIGFTTLRAQVRRRILVSYRVDPDVVAALLPAPFRPQLVDGSAVAGVCIIGLRALRPAWVQPGIGVNSENIAHRVAVEWDEAGKSHTGVYIRERHSSSLLSVLAGGRLFPGVHSRARFELDETDTRFRVRISAPSASVDVDVEVTDDWSSSLFPTLSDASAFYRSGTLGWSPSRRGAGVEPVEISSDSWALEAGRVRSIRSSFFDALPAGSAVVDSVAVMRDLPFLWQSPKRQPDAAALTPAPV